MSKLKGYVVCILCTIEKIGIFSHVDHFQGKCSPIFPVVFLLQNETNEYKKTIYDEILGSIFGQKAAHCIYGLSLGVQLGCYGFLGCLFLGGMFLWGWLGVGFFGLEIV